MLYLRCWQCIVLRQIPLVLARPILHPEPCHSHIQDGGYNCGYDGIVIGAEFLDDENPRCHAQADHERCQTGNYPVDDYQCWAPIVNLLFQSVG